MSQRGESNPVSHLPIASNKDMTKALVDTSHSIPKKAAYCGLDNTLNRSSQKFPPSVARMYASMPLVANALTIAQDVASPAGEDAQAKYCMHNKAVLYRVTSQGILF